MTKTWNGCEVETFCPFCTKRLLHQSKWSMTTDESGVLIKVNLICSNCMGDMFNQYVMRMNQDGNFFECEAE